MTILDSNVYNQSYKFNVQLIMIICKFSANYLQLPTGLVWRFDLSMSWGSTIMTFRGMVILDFHVEVNTSFEKTNLDKLYMMVLEKYSRG